MRVNEVDWVHEDLQAGRRHRVEHLLETVHRVHASHDVGVRANIHPRILRKVCQLPDAVEHLPPRVLLPHLWRPATDQSAETYQMCAQNLRVP